MFNNNPSDPSSKPTFSIPMHYTQKNNKSTIITQILTINQLTKEIKRTKKWQTKPRGVNRLKKLTNYLAENSLTTTINNNNIL